MVWREFIAVINFFSCGANVMITSGRSIWAILPEILQTYFSMFVVTIKTPEQFDAIPPEKKPKLSAAATAKKRKLTAECKKKHRVIYVEKQIYRTWKHLKEATPLRGRSDSDFAAYLLSLEMKWIER